METVAKLSKITRIHLRRRRPTQDSPPKVPTVRGREEQKEEEPVEESVVDGSLLARERKAREEMGLSHRIFHRRQEPNVVTVVVNVIATVDGSGNQLGLQTLPPTPSTAPAVVAAATVLPSVPPVPPFPSDLTVPAVPPFPWPSGVPTVADVVSNPLLTTATPVSAPATGTASAIISGVPTSYANSTLSSAIESTSLSSSSSLNSTSSTSTSSSQSSSSSSSSSSKTSVSSSPRPTTASSTIPAGGGFVAPTNTPQASPGVTDVPASSKSSDSGSAPTPTVVGSVVGSLAGFALILAIILILIRRHKRRKLGGALQLRDDNDTIDNQPIASSGQQMATTRSSAMPAGAAAFLNRFSGASKSTAESSTIGEKSFQRISGRKLPSAFSEGMTSEQFARDGTLSGSSFYRDDQGFYGGPGASQNKEFNKEIGVSSGGQGTTERIMPSPARTPVIHHPDDAPPWGTSRNGGNSTLSPPHTPNAHLPPRSTLGRSHPSHDGSRSSRFTEDV